MGVFVQDAESKTRLTKLTPSYICFQRVFLSMLPEIATLLVVRLFGAEFDVKILA